MTPPDVSGYYVVADGSGHFVATGDGTDVGRGQAGSESRNTAHLTDDTLDAVSVAYTSGQAVNYGNSRGQLLRGTANEITIYSRSKTVCNESNSNYTMWSIGISSATVDPTTGSWTSIGSIGVDIHTDGTLTSACSSRYAGNFEVNGGWYASSTPASTKVAVTALHYMCVDGQSAYAPPETWTRADGSSCQCTTSYAVSCVPATN